MRTVIKAFLLAIGITFGSGGTTSAAECEQMDRVLFGTWPHHLASLTTYVAERDGFFKAECIEVEMALFKESSHFDTTLQRGVEDAVYIANFTALLVNSMNRYLDANDGVRAYIVGYATDAVWGLYGKKGVPLGEGSKVSVFNCSWRDRILTEPLPSSEMDESFSVMLFSLLPWLREHYGDRMDIWCGGSPPEGFKGIHLVPTGWGSQRERAHLDDNGIDFAVHSIERGTIYLVGDDAPMELVVGPGQLRKFPEATLVASESCVKDESCRDVLARFNMGLEAARVWVHSGGIDRVEKVLLQYAAEADEGAIKNISTPEIAKRIAPYVFEHVVSERRLTRQMIEELIEYNELPVEPEDIVDERLIKMH